MERLEKVQKLAGLSDTVQQKCHIKIDKLFTFEANQICSTISDASCDNTPSTEFDTFQTSLESLKSKASVKVEHKDPKEM